MAQREPLVRRSSVSALDDLAAVAEADGLDVGVFYDPTKVTEVYRWNVRISSVNDGLHARPVRIFKNGATAAQAADAALDAYLDAVGATDA